MHRKLCERVDNMELLVDNQLDDNSHVSYEQIFDAINKTNDLCFCIRNAFHTVNQIQSGFNQLDIQGTDDRIRWFKHMLEMQSWAPYTGIPVQTSKRKTINEICNPEDGEPYILETLHSLDGAGYAGKYVFSKLYQPDNGCKIYVFSPVLRSLKHKPTTINFSYRCTVA